jgi:HlyD family secretion protein
MRGPTFVWLLKDDNRAARVEVTIGSQVDGRAEVTSGLSGGERVILNPPETIKVGMLLKERT